MVRFGKVAPGGSTTRVFTIRNMGAGPLTLTDQGRQPCFLTVSGDFTLDTSQVPDVLPPGGQASFTVTFAPQGYVAKHARIGLRSNDSKEPNFLINLTGEADVVPPDIHLRSTDDLASNATFDFGYVRIDRTQTVVFTITNTGAGVLRLTDPTKVAVVGEQASRFVVDASATATELATGASTTFRITYRPDVLAPAYLIDAQVARVVVPSNDPDETTYVLNLRGLRWLVADFDIVHEGRRVAPQAMHRFVDSLAVGEVATKTFVVANTANQALLITHVGLFGSHPSDFTLNRPAVPFDLPPGDSVAFTVTFAPKARGTKSVFVSVLGRESKPFAGEFGYGFNCEGYCHKAPVMVVRQGRGIPIIDKSSTSIYLTYESNVNSAAYHIKSIGELPLVLSPPQIIFQGGGGTTTLDLTSLKTTLLPGDSTSFVVTLRANGFDFHPSSEIEIVSNNSEASRFTFNVLADRRSAWSGIGVTQGATPVHRFDVYNFGSPLPANQAGRWLPFSVTNQGSDTLVLAQSSFGVTGNNAADFEFTTDTTGPARWQGDATNDTPRRDGDLLRTFCTQKQRHKSRRSGHCAGGQAQRPICIPAVGCGHRHGPDHPL